MYILKIKLPLGNSMFTQESDQKIDPLKYKENRPSEGRPSSPAYRRENKIYASSAFL